MRKRGSTPDRDAERGLIPKWGHWVRKGLGAGLYPRINQWLDPVRQYSQIFYAQLLSNLIPPGASWLDAGCGHQIFKLGSASAETEIVARTSLAVGCDLTWQALLVHRSLKLTVGADLRFLPFATNSFDVVTLNYVAEHLEDPMATFEEVARVLRAGGLLVIVTPNARGYFVGLTRLGRKFIPEWLVRKFVLLREYRSAEDIFPTFYRANTRRDLMKYLGRAGFAEGEFRMLRDPAMFNFIAPLAVVELLVIRFLAMIGFRDFAAGTIIASYHRAASQSTRLHNGPNNRIGNGLLQTPSVRA